MIRTETVKRGQQKTPPRGLNERRKSLRLDLALPVNVVRIGAMAVSLSGRTRNLSGCGAYFVIDGEMEPGSLIEFLVSLDSLQKVRLRCQGRVSRAEKLPLSGRLGVAATIQRYGFIRTECREHELAAP